MLLKAIKYSNPRGATIRYRLLEPCCYDQRIAYPLVVFFHGAALLLLLGLDFFAMTFLVVYVGAIAVLFLFVVMMLNINVAELQERRLRYLPMGGVLGLLLFWKV